MNLDDIKPGKRYTYSGRPGKVFFCLIAIKKGVKQRCLIEINPKTGVTVDRTLLALDGQWQANEIEEYKNE